MGFPLRCQLFILLRKNEGEGRVSSLGLGQEKGGAGPSESALVGRGGQLAMNDKREAVNLSWHRDVGPGPWGAAGSLA